MNSGRGEIGALLSKLYKTHQEAGGTIGTTIPVDEYSFDANKIILVSKIEACRNLILKKNDKKISSAAKLKAVQNIRSMIVFIQGDAKKLSKIYDSNFKANLNEDELKSQKTDLDLITLHVNDLTRIIESFNSSSSDFHPTAKSTLDSLEVEQSQTLAPLDLKDSIARVHRYRERLDSQLESFSIKVDKLKGIIQDTQDELDGQVGVISSINTKVDSETTNLIGITKGVQKSANETNQSTRLCIMFILIVVLLFLGSIVFLYISILIK